MSRRLVSGPRRSGPRRSGPRRSGPRRRPAAVLAVLVAGAAAVGSVLAGCASDPREGWSTRPLHDRDVDTVAVPIARNATFDRSVHVELTEAIVKAIEARTPWRVVPEARARTILDVTVREVDLEELSRSRATGLSEEMSIGLVVDFDWSRVDTGEVLAGRREFADSALFVPSPPAGERIDLGRFDVVGRTADAIVDVMQSDW